MRFAFVNNFEQILAQAVSDTDTTITLDGGGSELDNASEDLVYVLTLFHVDSNGNETEREIVHVTGVSGDTLTVTRAQEGTTAQAWAVGDGVSQRLTAGVLGAVVYNTDPLIAGVNAYGSPAAGSVILAGGLGASGDSTHRNVVIGDGEGVGEDAVVVGFDNYPSSGNYLVRIGTDNGGSGTRSVVLGHGNYPGAERAIALGGGNYPTGLRSVALGHDSYPDGDYAISLGDAVYVAGTEAFAAGREARADGDYGIAAGSSARATGQDGIAAGRATEAWEARAVAVGCEAEAFQDCVSFGPYTSANRISGTTAYGGTALGESAAAPNGCVSVGSKTSGAAPVGTAVGPGASTSAPASSSFGHEAEATFPYAVAAGHKAKAQITGGFQLNALSYLPAEYSDEGAFASAPPTATRRASQQVVIATDPLDLTDDTAAVTLDLPADTMLFIDAIDVVIVASDGAGGDPEIQVGADDQDPADYLGSTLVTKTSVGGRESHDPLVTDGVTSLRVATAVAGTGTTYQAKVVFRGYVMEL